MSKKMELVTKNLNSISAKFGEIAKAHNAVRFEQECQYALHHLQNNDFLMKIAEQNPESLKSAILNVAGAGISLNPVEKHAYLVPRKGTVCLDVSYMGLNHLACETGSIRWVQADVVYKGDSFEKRGVNELPLHTFDPFKKERGELVGAYCVAKTIDGDFLTEVMAIDDIRAIKERSESGKKDKGPWVSDFNEMAKKTVMKRAAKTWPKAKSHRLDHAIHTINQHEGIDFEKEINGEAPIIVDYERRESQLEDIKRLLSALTFDMDAGEKIEFLEKQTTYNSWGKLSVRNNQELEEIQANLKTARTDMEREEAVKATATVLNEEKPTAQEELGTNVAPTQDEQIAKIAAETERLVNKPKEEEETPGRPLNDAEKSFKNLRESLED